MVDRPIEHQLANTFPAFDHDWNIVSREDISQVDKARHFDVVCEEARKVIFNNLRFDNRGRPIVVSQGNDLETYVYNFAQFINRYSIELFAARRDALHQVAAHTPNNGVQLTSQEREVQVSQYNQFLAMFARMMIHVDQDFFVNDAITGCHAYREGVRKAVNAIGKSSHFVVFQETEKLLKKIEIVLGEIEKQRQKLADMLGRLQEYSRRMHTHHQTEFNKQLKKELNDLNKRITVEDDQIIKATMEIRGLVKVKFIDYRFVYRLDDEGRVIGIQCQNKDNVLAFNCNGDEIAVSLDDDAVTEDLDMEKHFNYNRNRLQ